MFDPQTYSKRRQKLMQALDGGVVLLMGHNHSPMNYTENMYPFRQDSTFLYYMGLDLAGLAAMIDVDNGDTTVYGHKPGIDDVIWSGPQLSLNDLARMSGSESAAKTALLQAAINRVLAEGRRIHFLPPYRSATRTSLEELLGLRPKASFRQVSRELTRAVIAQRSVKETQEVAEIEVALEVTRDMHLLAMQMSQPGKIERTIAGRVEGLAIAGGGRLAYPCIFTRYGQVLHNHFYGNELQKGDLVVHDSGAASPRHYASDITRTIPVSGRFEDRQRVIYSAVLEAMESAITRVKPGVRFRDIHLEAAGLITQSLQQVGLMKGDVERSVMAGAHTLFFPHGLGHMMGLDVHDMENLGEDHVGYDKDTSRATDFGLRSLRLGKALKVGYVLTVEPGCYFIGPLIDQWRTKNHCAEFINYEEVDRWYDFGGVRIEENVVVTRDGCRVLGPPIPSATDDVEAACALNWSPELVAKSIAQCSR